MAENKNKEHAKVALCYVRQSYTRDGKDDQHSPERQRANIERVCEENDWIPEWYVDADGHKSGRTVKNRPGWLALEQRLEDPDVAVLIGNDLARLHRKGWRVGDLLDKLEKHDVSLVLAAPNRPIDTSTPMGRIFIQFAAIFDEWYAEDISQRAKDSVAHRKAQGKTIGMPPFGTFRGENGYLHPSTEGGWLTSDGVFVAGTENNSPEEDAVWRSFYDAAFFVLNLYAQGNLGLEKIAYTVREEGWPFRDRKGNPRPANRDDVRRVVANWAEYGGMVMDAKAKSRPAYEEYNVEELPFVEERAVFPITLLKKVAQVRQERTIKPTDNSVNRETFPYPLAGIVYCAHCDDLAYEQDNTKLRSRLGGSYSNGILRYRHKAGIKCGCHNRSVRCEILEADFRELIRLLEIKPEALELMTELAIQADKANGGFASDDDLEAQKQEAITLCSRKIDAAVFLFGEGRISQEEYVRRIEANEREIAHWEARTTETEKIALELGMCIEAVERISRLWDISDGEDRQGLVRMLFTDIVYDLDTRRIVDFRLKPWADRFLTIRAALYGDDGENGDDEGAGGDTQAASDRIVPENVAASAEKPPLGHIRMPLEKHVCVPKALGWGTLYSFT